MRLGVNLSPMPEVGLAIGQVAVVEVAADEEVPKLRAVVERVHAGSVTIRSPDGATMPRELASGTPVFVTYFDRSALYRFDACVRLRESTRIVVEQTGPVNEVQRRQHVRLARPVPVECVAVDEARGRMVTVDASTIDLGGGGIALNTAVELPTSGRVVVAVKPLGVIPILAVGSVVASDASGSVRAGSEFVTRVSFAAIAEPDRERLIKYVFENLGRH
jgi:c-di-GMP-binding flagellar brake protein YcgR